MILAFLATTGVMKELPGNNLDKGEVFFVITEELNLLLMPEIVPFTLKE